MGVFCPLAGPHVLFPCSPPEQAIEPDRTASFARGTSCASVGALCATGGGCRCLRGRRGRLPEPIGYPTQNGPWWLDATHCHPANGYVTSLLAFGVSSQCSRIWA